MLIETSLVGSVNWYDAACIAPLSSTCIAFSSRSFVFLATYTENDQKLKVSTSCSGGSSPSLIATNYFPAHHERVSGLVPLLGDRGEDLATCGHDGFVRIWKLPQVNQQNQKSHEMDEMQQPAAVCLREINLASVQSKLTTLAVTNTNVSGWHILVGAENGILVLCSLQGDREDVTQKKFEKDSVVVLEWEPKLALNDPTSGAVKVPCKRFAAGYKRGFVSVYTVNSAGSSGGSITLQQSNRIKAHDSDVCSLSWILPSVTPITGHLLTAGKEKVVKLWNLETNTMVKSLRIPGSSAAWISVCCTRSGPIVVSNAQGDVGTWDPSESGQSSKLQCFTKSTNSRGHTRQVFTICELPPSTKQQETSALPTTLITTGMDRSLSVWSLPTRQTIAWCPTLGGFVYALSASPIGGGCLVAVGTGDNLIRLWRVGSLTSVYDVTPIWNGINGRVTALAWHPSKEGLLGFGTDDGRVGIVNTLQDRRQGRISNSHHKGTVFGVSWGPRLGGSGVESSEENFLFLYSVGNYQLLRHDTWHLSDQEAEDAGSVLHQKLALPVSKMDITEVAFRSPDLSYLALGLAEGTVHVIQTDSLRLVATISSHKKSVNVLRWHSVTPWLAIGSNERFVSVTDLKQAIATLDSQDNSPAVVLTDCLVKLEGHTQRITSLDWSPHTTEHPQLLSVSFDGAAVVWEIGGSSKALCSFRGHHGRLFSCLWSPRDPDLVYTGGEDHNMLAWRPSLQTRGGPSESKKNRLLPTVVNSTGNNSTVQPEIQSSDRPTNDESELEELKQILAQKKQQLLQPNLTPHTMNLEEEIVDVKLQGDTAATTTKQQEPITAESISSKVKGGGHRRKRPSLFARTLQSETGDRTEGTLALARYLFKIGQDSTLPAYLTFLATSRREVLAHLETECAGQLEVGHLDNYLLLQVWMGRVSCAVELAWARHHLPDWFLTVVCLCTAVGGGRLVDSRLIDAKVQEVADGDVYLAATYLLASHRSREAIDLLANRQHFKEALILSLLRLPPSDPLNKKLIQQLADKEVRNGAYDQVGRCYLALARYTDAAEWLARRQTAVSLWIAAQTLRIVEETTAFRGYMLQLINRCFLTDLKTLQDTIEEWRQTLLSEGLHEYALLLDIFDALVINHSVTEGSFLCLQNKMSIAVSSLGCDGGRLSQLDEDLLAVVNSRQRSIHWPQAMAYLVHDIFLALYKSSEKHEMATSRLFESLRTCLSIDREATLQLASKLVDTAPNSADNSDENTQEHKDDTTIHVKLKNSTALCLIKSTREFIANLVTSNGECSVDIK